MTTPSRLIADLRELMARATPGPWSTKGGQWVAVPASVLGSSQMGTIDFAACFTYDSRHSLCGGNLSESTAEANAALIVAMRNAIGTLLERLEKAEAVCRANARLEADGSSPGACMALDYALAAWRKAVGE